MLGWIQIALVVIVDILFIVIHATVAYLDGIAVGDFSKLVVFRKVFAYQGEESVSDISADIFAKWRVVPVVCFVVSFSVWKSWLACSVECGGNRFCRVLFGMGGQLGRMMFCPMTV